MSFTDLFVRRPVLSLVVSLLILLVGARSLLVLPIRQYPKLDNTTITITTSYPGASANLMQSFISTPIEQAVSSAEGIDYVTANSLQGTSTVEVHVKLNEDPNKAMTDVMAKVQQVKYLLPADANDPVITKSTGQSLSIMYLSFSSAKLSRPAITDYLTRVVQPVLSTINGVAEAKILGGQTFAVRVWLKSRKDGRPRYLGIGRRDRHSRQQLPVGSRPDQGLLHRPQHNRGDGPHHGGGIPQNGGQDGERRAGPPR